jgi:hypothetical protein
MPSRKVTVRPPSKATLANYGLTAQDWLDMASRQNCTCPICQQPFGDRKLVIDHEHVRGWKARKGKLKSGKVRAKKDQRVMTPAQRKPHVRGILHAWCNGYVRSWLTLARAESILKYLQAHEGRRIK